MRSKRRPVGSRDGKKVGDPGTTGGSTGTQGGTPTVTEDSKGPRASKRHHARKPLLTRGLLTRATSPTPLGDDQFIQNFFYWALLRYPNSTELAYQLS